MEAFMVLILIVVTLVVFFRHGPRLKALEKKVKLLEAQLEAQSLHAASSELAKTTVAADAPVVDRVQGPLEQRVADTPKSVASAQSPPSQGLGDVVKPLQKLKSNKMKLPKETPAWRKDLFTVESIISKLGIFLLLIGVGYIFKLAYDNGYITEHVAVLFGAIIGGVLIYLGMRVSRKDRHVLSQVLFGGGVATLYITVYAAYLGYGLIGGIVAFIFMCAVTALGFILALITDSVAMSVIAILGGLLTPFVLELEQLGLFGTGIYIFMMSIAITGVYIFKRWRLLQISGIVGVYIVTGYFVTLTGVTDMERTQLALLMIAVAVIFTGTEYALAFIGKSSTRFPGITYGLLCALPLITLLELGIILDISDRAWSIAMAVIALLYVVVAYLLHRKGTEPAVVNITLALTATFALFSVLLYFGEGIEVVAVLMLAIIYYFLDRKLEGGFQVYVGHALMVIGVSMALDNIATDFGDDVLLVKFLTRILLVALMVGAALINKKIAKYCIATFALGLYLPLVMHLQLYQISEAWEPLAVMVVAHGLYIALLYLLNQRVRLMPNFVVIALGMLPFAVKLFASGLVLWEDQMNGYDVGAYIIYGILIYALAQFHSSEWGYRQRMLMKTMVYSIVMLLLLTDVAVGMEGFVFGLVPLGLVVLAIQFLEPERTELWMINLVRVLKVFWFVLILGYIFVDLFYFEFEWVGLIMDIILCIVLALNLKYLAMKVAIEVSVGVHGLIYAVLVYKNFQNLQYGNGIITLLWAAYAIALLTYSVIKTHKALVTMSLVFICGIAVKYVLIDLDSVSTLWKIIVSMVFGSALLGLSYFLQPILAGNRDRQK